MDQATVDKDEPARDVDMASATETMSRIDSKGGD